jgi:glycosyltransferase involved in cell wall biosynthesis
MAAGKPVVATRVDDVPELVEDSISGFLVPEMNVIKTVNALKKFIDNPRQREVMGKAGKAKIKNQFALTNQVKKYLQVYNSLLEKHIQK